MTTKRDGKTKPKTDEKPKLARPKDAVKDLEPKAEADEVSGGGRHMAKEEIHVTGSG